MIYKICKNFVHKIDFIGQKLNLFLALLCIADCWPTLVRYFCCPWSTFGSYSVIGNIYNNLPPLRALWHRSYALMLSRKIGLPPSLIRNWADNRSGIDRSWSLLQFEWKRMQKAEDDDIGSRSRRALLAPPRPVEPITWDRLLLDTMQ